ncbi:MAG: pentapeptide repeat-containing protein [Nitrosotalea sp.]
MRTIVCDDVKTKWFLPTLFLLGLVLFIARKPEAAFVTQPGRIEDASVLLSQAIQYSWASFFVVYNSYLHFVPRAVTLFSLDFGIANAPVVMNLTAIVIATLCAVFFATKQFRFIIKNDWLRAVCCLFIILVPGIDEIYSNISSIQWFLNIFLMLFTSLLLFRYDEYQKKSKKEKYLYTFFCSISFLSSAFSVIFLPVLVYVIIREFRKNKNDLIAISSYAVPAILLLLQTLVLYITYSQQSRSPTLGVGSDVVISSINAFTISITKVFYHATPDIFQYLSGLMYLVPVAVVAFILLNSIKNGLRFEIYTLICMMATLFWTSLVRRDLLDWQCLCGQMEERYFFFAVAFAFILIVRQFDKRRSPLFMLVLLVTMIIITSNVVSGFSISFYHDDNWKYVAKLYDSSGQYQCYIGEVPHGWSIFIPCAKPVLTNETVITPNLSSAGPSVTFTPPIQQTTTSIAPSVSSVISGLPVTFTATISPTPNGGAVQFYVDGAAVNNPITIFGGQATLSTSMLSLGQHNVFASYLGGPNFNASMSDSTIVTVLSMSDLQGASLQDANLQGINLSGANLKQVNLSGANLQGANLQGADLSGADLQSANLQGADLVGANLQNANLSGSILKGANTNGTNFAGATTNGCNGCP